MLLRHFCVSLKNEMFHSHFLAVFLPCKQSVENNSNDFFNLRLIIFEGRSQSKSQTNTKKIRFPIGVMRLVILLILSSGKFIGFENGIDWGFLQKLSSNHHFSTKQFRESLQNNLH